MFYFMPMLLAFSLILVSCDEDDDDEMVPPMSESIVDIAAGEAQFSLLVEALTITGLAATLDNENNDFTVFAPTNAAFSRALNELGFTGLSDIPTEDLTQILLYHVMSGENLAADISTGYYSTLSAGPEDGYNLSMYVDIENTIINDRSNISVVDVMADNGVIHVIDEVLLPLSITGHATANPAFTSLAAAVTKAGLADALADPDAKYTVFAPTNSAFENLFTDLGVTLDDLDAETLTPILLYHVVDAFVPAANVESGYASTLSPAQGRTASLLISADNDGVALNNSSNVVVTDVVATNGIIHAIDGVILPPNIVEAAIDNPGFSTLVEAVVKANLVDALSAEGPLTVFAPTNAAFDALFTALNVSGIADLSGEDLTPILLSHVVAGNVASSNLSNGEVPTLNTDKTLNINVGEGVVIDENINVIVTDVQGTNGIVHAIDKVIVP